MQYFFFDRQSLQQRAAELRTVYQTATPFPHIVIDNFLPASVIERVLEDINSETIPWTSSDRYFETKSSCNDEEHFPPFTRQLTYAFNSGVFLEFLEQLSGIPALMTDPHFVGGGIHQIRQNGKLGIHVDFNFYERLQVHRRLNVLLYLNNGWRSEYGGQLELWDPKMQECQRRIEPILNRCVVFSTTESSFHGHPEPLQCPPPVARRSLAFYYYTSDRPVAEQSVPHNTVFRVRPGETKPRDRVVQRVRSAARRFVPPGVINAVRRAREMMR